MDDMIPTFRIGEKCIVRLSWYNNHHRFRGTILRARPNSGLRFWLFGGISPEVEVAYNRFGTIESRWFELNDVSYDNIADPMDANPDNLPIKYIETTQLYYTNVIPYGNGGYYYVIKCVRCGKYARFLRDHIDLEHEQNVRGRRRRPLPRIQPRNLDNYYDTL